MTFAELLSTVDHARQQLDTKAIPYHKIEVSVSFTQNSLPKTLGLYPGKVNLQEAVLEFEAE